MAYNDPHISVFVQLNDGSEFEIASSIKDGFLHPLILGFFCGNRDMGDFSRTNDLEIVAMPYDADKCDGILRVRHFADENGECIDFIIRNAADGQGLTIGGENA